MIMAIALYNDSDDNDDNDNDNDDNDSDDNDLHERERNCPLGTSPSTPLVDVI